MTQSEHIQFTLGLDDPELDDDDRLKFATRLLPELRQVDEVDRADRTEDVTSLEGAKGYTTLVGWLTADVSAKNIVGFLAWIASRFADAPVKVKVKVGDREVELESDKLQDPEATAMKLLEVLKGDAGA